MGVKQDFHSSKSFKRLSGSGASKDATCSTLSVVISGSPILPKVNPPKNEAKDYRDIAKMIKAGISIKKGEIQIASDFDAPLPDNLLKLFEE